MQPCKVRGDGGGGGRAGRGGLPVQVPDGEATVSVARAQQQGLLPHSPEVLHEGKGAAIMPGHPATLGGAPVRQMQVHTDHRMLR